MKKNLTIVAVALSLALIPLYGHSETGVGALSEFGTSGGNIKVGALEIHPGVIVDEIYSDNLYSTAKVTDVEKKGWYNVVTPGVVFKLPLQDHSITAGYAVEKYSYHTYSNEDYWAHTAQGGISLNFPGGLTLGVDNTFLKTRDFRNTEDSITRVSHIDNNVSTSVGYVFPSEKLSFNLSYGNKYLKFDQVGSKAENRRDDTFSGTLFYKFLPKTSILAGYSVTDVNYFDSTSSTNGNSTNSTAYVGLKWDGSTKFFGELKGGWSSRNYKNSLNANGNTYNDRNSWSSEVSMTYFPQKQTRFIVSFNKSFAESTYAGTGAIAGTSGYDKTKGEVNLEHYFTRKISVNLIGTVSKSDYEALGTGVARKDGKINAHVSAKYRIQKWLQLKGHYEYSNTLSSDSAQDIVVNKFGINLIAAF